MKRSDKLEGSKLKTMKVPRLDIRANILENSFDEKENTIDVIASAGSRVKRRRFFSEDFLEELEISKDAVNLNRFQTGAPVLMDHSASSIRNQLGVVENAKIVNGQIRAKIRFSKREEFQDIISDIKDNIIRNVSVGYNVDKFQELDERQNGLKVFRATKWTPAELSFVTIGADEKAQTRSAESEHFNDCEFIERSSMENKTAGKGNENRSLEGGEVEQTSQQTRDSQIPVSPKPSAMPPVDLPKTEPDLEQVRKEAVESERTRVTQIREAVSHAGFEDKKADEFIERGTSIESVREMVLKQLSERDKNTNTTNFQVGENLSARSVSEGIENAILNRANPSKYKISDVGQNFRNMRLIDMARDYLNIAGQKTRNMNPNQVVSLALKTRAGAHSTSDFPEILANVVNKSLRDAYQEAPQTFQPFTRMTTVTDFKEISRTQLGDAPQLLLKNENGEYQSGTTSEQAEKYSVEEYGRVVPIGRRVLVDDDLNAFSRIVPMMGRQARNLESQLAWAEITSNPVMADGNALFSAAHNNLTTGPGTAISIASLGVGRASIRNQVSLDGSKLNLTPSWLYVPVILETIADQFTSQIIPNASGDVNPFSVQGRTPLTVGTESRLDDDSVTAWYLFANIGDIDMLEMAMLTGEEAPVTDSMVDFDTDAIKFKIRHTVGVKAIDHRGMYKNDGA